MNSFDNLQIEDMNVYDMDIETLMEEIENDLYLDCDDIPEEETTELCYQIW